MQNLIYAAPVAGVLALVFAWSKASWVSQQDPGEANMVEIAGRIQEGALAFLRAEYRVLSIFVLVVGAILGIAYFGDLVAEQPDEPPEPAVSTISTSRQQLLAKLKLKRDAKLDALRKNGGLSTCNHSTIDNSAYAIKSYTDGADFP